MVGEMTVWLTAKEVAKLLQVQPSWVYTHKKKLGYSPIREGPRPRIRFDAAKVNQYMERHRIAPAGARPGRPRKGTAPTVYRVN